MYKYFVVLDTGCPTSSALYSGFWNGKGWLSFGSTIEGTSQFLGSYVVNSLLIYVSQCGLLDSWWILSQYSWKSYCVFWIWQSFPCRKISYILSTTLIIMLLTNGCNNVIIGCKCVSQGGHNGAWNMACGQNSWSYSTWPALVHVNMASLKYFCKLKYFLSCRMQIATTTHEF